MMFHSGFYVKSKYVDLNDLDNPIKEYTEALNEWKLHPEIFYRPNYYIDRHEITLEDSVLGGFTDDDPIMLNKICERESVEIQENIGIGVDFLADAPYSFTIQLSPDKYQYKRSVFTFFELVGIIGGLFEVFEISFALLFGLAYSHFAKQSLATQIRKNRAELSATKTELKKLRKSYNELAIKPNFAISQEEKKAPPDINRSFKKILIESLKKLEADKQQSDRLAAQSVDELSGLKKDIKPNCDIDLEKLKSEVSQLDKKPKPSQLESSSFLVDDFYSNTDCINLIYKIKILESKVDFLFQAQPNFENFGQEGSPNSSQVLRTEEREENKKENFHNRDNSFVNVIDDLQIKKPSVTEFNRDVDKLKVKLLNKFLS